MNVFLRTEYNYDMNKESDLSGFDWPDDNPAQQQFKAETDINEIVRRFGLTGTLPADYRPPQSGDFTDVMDFQTAMNAVREAQENFMLMPPELRARFNNDPQRLMAFLDDDSNRDEAKKLGLMATPKEQTRDGHTLPLRVVIDSPTPTPGATKE